MGVFMVNWITSFGRAFVALKQAALHQKISLLAAVLILIPVRAFSQPTNDNFAQRLRLEGSVVDFGGSNIGATLEVGEPQVVTCTKTLWWEWTAPFEGRAVVEASGDFPPVIAIYTGSAITNLQEVAAETFFSYYKRNPQLYFQVSAGTTYFISGGSPIGQVPGFSTYQGPFQARLSLYPPRPTITSPTAPTLERAVRKRADGT
jgi:hypothetical protein